MDAQAPVVEPNPEENSEDEPEKNQGDDLGVDPVIDIEDDPEEDPTCGSGYAQFPNCRTYDNAKGFVEATNKALNDEPSPLIDDQLHELSWEAATEQFLKVTKEADKFTFQAIHVHIFEFAQES
ncbi:hypothetical protein ACH5RR_041048 [Cinchona calisaya]|uniref:Uncharacterized protein n=1 Tax=Cinchona calisaya TaxID=153742 RepID=A0ABD2XUD4_9GENT